MRITASKPGVTTEFGIAVPVGSTTTVGDEYGKSLVLALVASDTDSVLPGIPNTPFLPVPIPPPDTGGGIPASRRCRRLGPANAGPWLVNSTPCRWGWAESDKTVPSLTLRWIIRFKRHSLLVGE